MTMGFTYIPGRFVRFTLEHSKQWGWLMKRMLNVKEVCSILRIDRGTLYRLIREEHFPAVRVSNKWRFIEEQVHAWIDSQVYMCTTGLSQVGLNRPHVHN